MRKITGKGLESVSSNRVERGITKRQQQGLRNAGSKFHGAKSGSRDPRSAIIEGFLKEYNTNGESFRNLVNVIESKGFQLKKGTDTKALKKELRDKVKFPKIFRKF